MKCKNLSYKKKIKRKKDDLTVHNRLIVLYLDKRSKKSKSVNVITSFINRYFY